MKKHMELVKEKSVQDFHNRNVEEKLRCLNVVRNLYSTMLEHQSTRSLYSRLKCMDAYLVDLVEAISSKTQTTRQMVEAQHTEYREEELAKLEKLNDSVPVLVKLIGDSLEENFQNRSVKIKNIKLAIGDTIYKEILLKTFEGEMHSFSSDGVEDIKIRHSINLFLQSETSNHGECVNYFGRIKYAEQSMDHAGESQFLLDMINRCLPGFPGEVR